MRKFPACPCQSGLTEFCWELVCYVGRDLGGYEVFRCPDCGHCAYHFATFGLFFVVTKGLAPTENVLLFFLRVERTLSTVRDSMGNRTAGMVFRDIPENIRLFQLDEQRWGPVGDRLRILVPSQVPRPAKVDNYLINLFLHPPPICQSSFG